MLGVELACTMEVGPTHGMLLAVRVHLAEVGQIGRHTRDLCGIAGGAT